MLLNTQQLSQSYAPFSLNSHQSPDYYSNTATSDDLNPPTVPTNDYFSSASDFTPQGDVASNLQSWLYQWNAESFGNLDLSASYNGSFSSEPSSSGSPSEPGWGFLDEPSGTVSLEHSPSPQAAISGSGRFFDAWVPNPLLAEQESDATPPISFDPPNEAPKEIIGGLYGVSMEDCLNGIGIRNPWLPVFTPEYMFSCDEKGRSTIQMTIVVRYML